MNKFINIVAIMLVFMIWFGITSAYNLTDKDFDIIDTIEENIYDKIDNNKNITAEAVIQIIENIQEKKQLSARINTILDIIVEDLEIDYLDDYSYSENEEIWYKFTQADCYEGELFDEEEKYCYIDVYEDEDLSGEYLDENFEWNWNEISRVQQVVYKINWDTIKILEGSKEEKHDEMWKLFITIIPKNYRIDFAQYIISNDSKSDTFAHVEQNTVNNNKWDINLNMAAFYDEKWVLIKGEAIHTLIHEFAHVLTLNKTQVKYFPANFTDEKIIARFEWKCNSNLIMEGCLFEKAYLNSFILKFWKINFIKLNDAKEDEELDFYTWKETHFVSDYAATNPGEDIAETFTTFVLKTKPTWDTIADKKVLMMYEYPELLALKQVIKSRLTNVK